MTDEKVSEIKSNILNCVTLLDSERRQREVLCDILEDIAHGGEVSLEVKTTTAQVRLVNYSFKHAPGIIASFVGEVIEALDEKGLDHIEEIVKDCNALLGIESKQ